MWVNNLINCDVLKTFLLSFYLLKFTWQFSNFQLQDGWSRPIFLPRFLGALESNRSDCNLYGWGEVNGHNRHSEAISIFSSTFCTPNFEQVFCTTFASASHATCTAIQGSPVTCGDESIVAGILINNGTCSHNGNRILLNYHSVHDFTDWIIEISGAKVTSKTSIVLILSAVWMILSNVMWFSMIS